MTAPSVHIKNVLVTAGVGTYGAASGWCIRVSRLTDAPHTQVVIYDTSGQPPNPKFLLDFPGIQVMVRGAPDTYEATFAKMKEVKDALLGIDSQNIGGDRLDSITGLGDIIFMQYDEKNRPQFVANFQLILEPSSGLHRESL